mgnify:CR=1 FL=1
MDEKIIKDSRVIDKIIKIKTIYNINHLINHFHLSKKNIKNLLEENIPINVLNLNIIESQTEKQINEAIDICFSEFNTHKYIYIKIKYNFKYHINYECNNVSLKYIKEVFNNNTLKFIQLQKDKINANNDEKLKRQINHLKNKSKMGKKKKKKK